MSPPLQPPRVVDLNGETIPLKALLTQQIVMIDEALSSLGEFGEVHLIVEKRRLRFIITQKSFDALKWQPGDLIEAR